METKTIITNYKFSIKNIRKIENKTTLSTKTILSY